MNLNDPKMDEISIFILVILSNTSNCIKNPYLLAKYVEILYNTCPMIQPQTKYLNGLLINSPFAERVLVPVLMKFYADVERTGASSEFYDKFRIRFNISIIFKTLWEDPKYQVAFINESRFKSLFF